MILGNISTQIPTNTSFGCNNPNCQHKQVATVPNGPQQDVVELSQQEEPKKPGFLKKSVNFVKENPNKIKAFAKSSFNGFLGACTILGANQLMQSVSKANTKPLANKLAIIGFIAITAKNLYDNRDAFKKDKCCQTKKS